jgi:eukaryotic-like serine/threonine-protein kinase
MTKLTASQPPDPSFHAGESSSGTGRNVQSRVRLFAIGVFLVSVFLHAVAVLLRVTDGTDYQRAAFGGSELAHLLLIALSATFVTLLSWHRFTPEGLARIDVAVTLLVPITGVLDMYLHPPVPMPEMLTLLLLTLVLGGRAAVVPSSAVRTALVGLLSLTPLAATTVLADCLRTNNSGPEQMVLFAAVFGFGIAAVGVSVVTSHIVHRLRRKVRWATQLGPYVVGRKLDEGGMGTVYEAWHALLKRRTALKLVKPSLSGARADERFAAEARITSELNHPNTVSLYDYGCTSDGIYYYAMELVDGITLDELSRHEGTLPAGRVTHLLRQVAASLAHAHARGLIHRDIKPTNVMVCNREGQPDLVKVLDFGLAMRVSASDEPDSSRAGTPAFMPPEVARDLPSVGPASDVYSVAVLGYVLLTGSLPFSGKSAHSMLHAHVHQPPIPPSLRSSKNVPRDLEMVLLSCLDKDPEKRPRDGSELLKELEKCRPDPAWTNQDARDWWASFDETAPWVANSETPEQPTTQLTGASLPIPPAVRRVSFG